MSLLREYFSINKKDTDRKFKFPMNQNGIQNNERASDLYDELQYCLESDIEGKKEKKMFRKKNEEKMKMMLDNSKKQLDMQRNTNVRQSTIFNLRRQTQ